MKELIHQFYNEGFATIFYKKPINYLKRKIKNKKILHFISILIKIFYTVIIITLALIIFYKKLPI